MNRLASKQQLHRITGRLLDLRVPENDMEEFVIRILSRMPGDDAPLTTKEATQVLNVLYMEYQPE
jgi:hypothetical protein